MGEKNSDGLIPPKLLFTVYRPTSGLTLTHWAVWHLTESQVDRVHNSWRGILCTLCLCHTYHMLHAQTVKVNGKNNVSQMYNFYCENVDNVIVTILLLLLFTFSQMHIQKNARIIFWAYSCIYKFIYKYLYVVLFYLFSSILFHVDVLCGARRTANFDLIV